MTMSTDWQAGGESCITPALQLPGQLKHRQVWDSEQQGHCSHKQDVA